MRNLSPRSAGTLISDFQSPELWVTNFIVYKLPSLVFYEQPKWTKTQGYIFPLWFQKDIHQPKNPICFPKSNLSAKTPPKAAIEYLLYIYVINAPPFIKSTLSFKLLVFPILCQERTTLYAFKVFKTGFWILSNTTWGFYWYDHIVLLLKLLICGF